MKHDELLTEDDIEGLIDDTRKKAPDLSIHEVVGQMKKVGKLATLRLRSDQDAAKVRRSIWSAILSQILIKGGDAETYAEYLQQSDNDGYVHLSEKFTHHCVLAQLWRSEGDKQQGIAILEQVLLELKDAPQDSFVAECYSDGQRLISAMHDEMAQDDRVARESNWDPRPE